MRAPLLSAIPFSYVALLALGVALMPADDDKDLVQDGDRLWSSAQRQTLLERSFVRCLRERAARENFGQIAEDLQRLLALQRDDWSLTLTAADIDAAPLEPRAARLYIQCGWFVPIGQERR